MTARSESLLRSFQKMPENNFTKLVLVPLFKSFGFTKVEFHGGNDELGKDLICWREDEIGEIELTVAQTKRYKPTRTASDSHSFSGIVTQLCQCLETPVPFTDGNTYLPSGVYLVTPFEIDTHTLSTRFAKVAALKQSRIKILDGTKLVRITQDRLPDVVSSLIGGSEAITKAITPHLSNNTLMSALGFQTTRHIKDFYTDIDIAVGHVQARYLVASSFKPVSQHFDISEKEWRALQTTLATVETEFQVSLIRESSAQVTANLRGLKATWETWKEENRRRNAKAEDLSTQVGKLRIEVIAGAKLATRASAKESTVSAQITRTLKAIDDGDEMNGKSEKYAENTSKLLVEYRRLRALCAEAKRQSTVHDATEPTIKTRINGTGRDLAEKLVSARNGIRSVAAKLNAQRPTSNDLRGFIAHCQSMFSVSASVLQNYFVAQLVGFSPTSGPISEYTRLSLPAEVVFDSGLNIAVLGEAGAGKTTALQMYAYRHYELPKLEQLVIYAPLAHLVRLIPAKAVVGSHEIYPIDESLVKFLSSLGAAFSLEDFRESAAKGGIVLLDSIDEAYAYAPGIIDSLVSFSRQYPRIQLITSSRISGEYAEKIPFVGIFLMPFTDSQQTEFISSWFGPAGKDHIAVLQKHLRNHAEVADVVRTPLLATAMCALQENRVPLPTNEIRLYEEWLNLLVGVYDTHKKINRIKSARHHLQSLAEKIAFRMHVNGQREESRIGLVRCATELFDSIMSPADAQLVLDELVHPCNVMVPMGWSDKLGFGHLRYQEYLTARELRHNRGLRIAQFVGSSWWKGVLMLFAQMHESLDWLVDEIAEHPLNAVAQENLLAMIEAGPKRGRKDFHDFVVAKTKLDGEIEDSLSALQDVTGDPSSYAEYRE